MAKRRELTTEEKLAAATFRRHLTEAARHKSQQAIADEIGVTQGAIWQWADGMIPITAKRARAVAKAVGADPNEISVAFRELNLPTTADPHSASASHLTTPDPDIVHEALTLLVHDEEQAGPYPPRAKARRLSQLIGRVIADGGRLSDANNAAFMREVEARSGGRVVSIRKRRSR